jgi:serine/threonine-protein kinase
VADTHPPEDSATKRAPRSVRTGDTLGRYEIFEELGEGGMATVFRAKDKELRRDVAVKVLFPHLARRVEIVKRFHREARAAAGLEHGNILRIYDVGGGEGDDPPYIVMELIRGRTLLEEIEQRGPMLAEIAASVGALLADALAAAHAAGIVHRDIKPSNVLVAPGGRLLLADFGVARLETENSLVTRTGALLGTPAYMSPEQASGDIATAKSDLYSLGATLYQLATGHLPYTGSPAKVMSQIAAGTLVSPVRRRTAVGPDLSRMIEQMMAGEPALRPASAQAISAELRGFAAKGGFAEPTEELASYFADPDAFVKTKTPAIVSALLVTAERAIAEDRLPRAIAIADRASALAPDDPAVDALIAKVTEGGRSSRRRKLVLAGGLALVLAGGATFAGMKLFGGAASPQPVPVDAATEPRVDAETAPDAPTEAPADAPTDARIDAPIDAAPRRTLDANVAAIVPRDVPAPADAHVIDVPVSVDAPPEKGKVEVVTDTWCELSIDGAPRGRLQGKMTVELDAGPHTILCMKPGMAEWTKTVDVLPGKTVRAEGAFLAPVTVRLELDAEIGGTSFSRGDATKLKPGRTNVKVGGKSLWVDIPRVSCRLHQAAGRLVCDPG